MEIKECVIKLCQNVADEQNIEIVINENTKISRDNGIDSLGIVSLVFDIEEELNIELEDYLTKIRKCKNVCELIKVIEEAFSNK